jgi:indolepyruvate ferredoxin oxidoreductase beta subunit
MDTTQPVSILIAALGGEGGGVLCEWLVDAATQAGHPVQGTSIPGVAQRTGATTYYVEISQRPLNTVSGGRPVFSLTPVAGCVDLVIASELLEMGRVLSLGYIDPEHTTLISSNTRTLTTFEKMAMGDGRFDLQRLLTVATRFAAEFVSFDMQEAARGAQTVVSAVMFGALAASGKLPFDRVMCEAAIKASGKGVEASLAGFEAGYQQVARARGLDTVVRSSPKTTTLGSLPPALEQALKRFPGAAHDLLVPAVVRLLDYQDLAYVDLFLKRLDRLQASLSDAQPDARVVLLRETARFLALWMSFDDVVRVADLKTRASRFSRVRAEVGAKPREIVRISDYFKPRIEEMAGILPPGWSRAVLRWQRSRGQGLGFALTLKTDSFVGFMALRLIAALRPLRRRSARFAEEQARISAWLAAIERVIPLSIEGAIEIALCGRLVKGYGDTHARGYENLERILTTLAAAAALTRFPDGASLASAIRIAREAALADPEGKALDRSIAQHGAVPRPVVAKPIIVIRPARV